MNSDDVLIAQTIQLALAPVFVLVAIGNIMNILSTRLGRVVDRSRALQARFAETEGMEHDVIVREIRSSDRRIKLISRAVLLLVLSGLTIGMVVAMLFVEEFADVNIQPVAATAFLIAIGLLMLALLMFLQETREATRALRIPKAFLELDRDL